MVVSEICSTDNRKMSKKKQNKEHTGRKFSPSISNKKARFQYRLIEKLEAGIVLRGTEVKSLRNGKASLEEAFCRIRNGELFMEGCHISLYEQGNVMNHEPLRSRKLLVHRRELKKIEARLNQKGLTMVPLRIYFSRGRAKVEIALAEGKTHSDKREKIRKRETDRDIKRSLGRWR